MKKVLIATGIFAPDIGGPASYARTLGDHLAKITTVTVVTYSSPWSFAKDKDLSFRVIRVWRKVGSPLRHIIYFFKLWNQARRHDVILALSSGGAALAVVWAARLSKKKFYIKIVGDKAWETAIQDGKTVLLINDFQKEKKTGRIGKVHRAQVFACHRAQGVIVPSEYLANLVHGWGIPREKIHVIYNGVDFESLDLLKEDARKEIGIPGNIILSAGRLVPWKGFRMLIKIMPQLLQINQFIRLVIIGDGPDLKSLQGMVRNLNLDRKVHFVGRKTKKELALYLTAADTFVLNTGYEGFSHQILEAMAAGVPVITTAVGGNPEVIDQGENGLLVKYNDEFNLIEAIKSMWDLPELKEKFIEGGKKTVEHFSVARMLDETTTLLNQ